VPALYFLFKLWAKEYNRKTATLSILLFLSFPTAFYFGAIYPEALFLLLAILVFWFAKKGNLFLAGVFAALASATKVQGILLFLFLAIELWNKYKKVKMYKKFWLDLAGVIISPLGLIAYMLFLKGSVGDPLFFLTSQPAFGAGRSSLPLILLPQVIYRYMKIFVTVNPLSLTFFNAMLELVFTSVLVVGLVVVFKKIKFSYWLFVCLAVILPTLTGTLSSMPRYALLAFPIIPIIAIRFNKASKYIIIAQSVLQVVLLSLFIRGYWVA
jgi:Gpi18-like mannosyltransferase